jgi:tetratricopeptide (TPR) repeat protein
MSSERYYSRVVAGAVVAYAFLAGFHTMDDPDMWWQLAAGRYIAATGHIARTEVFSYTALGAPWIYPQGAGLLFYALYSLGGFVLLSLLSALALAGIALLLARKGGLLRCAIVALAIPVISLTTTVRANLFTSVLASVFLTILYEDLNPWLLPPLMLLWVNLHPGFIYGLALTAGFALIRPRKLGPAAAATAIATLVNPWGWRVYEGIAAQSRSMPLHRAFVAEWTPTTFSLAAILDSLRWRDPVAAFWWLVGVAAIAICCGVFRKRPLGPRLAGPLLLVASAAAAIAYFRFQTLFAIAAAVVIPDLLPQWIPPLKARYIAAALLLAFIGSRSYDLASNQFYYSHSTPEAFGTGISARNPERAARFIEEHHLPREIYHDYSLGGYLGWRLNPQYPVFIDGRALPYGDPLFIEQEKLATSSPDSPAWTAAFQRYKIHTIIVSTDRGSGFVSIPLRDACNSPLLRLVYMDAAAAVFVTTAELNTPALDCRTIQLPPPTSYREWLNAVRLYGILERPEDGERALAQARAIFQGDPTMQFELALLRESQGRTEEAESAFRRDIEMESSERSWNEYGVFLVRQGRYNEARQAYQQAVPRAARRHNAYSALAQGALLAGRPKQALEAANLALKTSPYSGPLAQVGASFTARMQAVRGEALLSLVRVPEAIDAFEQAVRIVPSGSPMEDILYLRLADAYYQHGRNADAQRAMAHSHQRNNPAAREHLEWLLKLNP